MTIEGFGTDAEDGTAGGVPKHEAERSTNGGSSMSAADFLKQVAEQFPALTQFAADAQQDDWGDDEIF